MVTTYKGNVGHLMQHWTLCELLDIADQHNTPGLNYIDAHAMAPLAIKNENSGKTAPFITVRNRLTPHGASPYERAWYKLAPTKGYPNSAAFVKKLWKGDFSLLLCEIAPATNAKLKPWLQCARKADRCKRAELFQGDWRERFGEKLPSLSLTELAEGGLTLIVFDPDMCSRHRNVARKNIRNLYPEDLELAMDAVKCLEGSILIQLSTYSANGDNPQGAVISSANSILAGAGFTLLAVMRVNGHMMSLVYARNVPWWTEVTRLPDRFRKWLPAR